jgi:hypothetical protein
MGLMVPIVMFMSTYSYLPVFYFKLLGYVNREARPSFTW